MTATREDVHAELAALMDTFFRTVTFAPGQTPGYEGIHELFAAEGKLVSTLSGVPETWTVDRFVESRRRLVDSGALTRFSETELTEITEVFGNVAHRFSTYRKRGTLKGAPIEATGVISTQFVRTPAGWRMSSMAWDDERPGLTIPARYR